VPAEAIFIPTGYATILRISKSGSKRWKNQYTFVDTFSKIAHCKLYVIKTPITAAGSLLNDRVLPFYESQGSLMLRILTNRCLYK